MFFRIFQKSVGTHSACVSRSKVAGLLGNSRPFLLRILQLGMYTNPFCVDGFLVSLYLYFVHSIVLGVAFQPAIQPELLSATFHLLWDKSKSKPLRQNLVPKHTKSLTTLSIVWLNHLYQSYDQLKGVNGGYEGLPVAKPYPWTPNAVLDEAGGLTFHDPTGLELTSEICG